MLNKTDARDLGRRQTAAADAQPALLAISNRPDFRKRFSRPLRTLPNTPLPPVTETGFGRNLSNSLKITNIKFSDRNYYHTPSPPLFALPPRPSSLTPSFNRYTLQIEILLNYRKQRTADPFNRYTFTVPNSHDENHHRTVPNQEH
jgi:hypothetical protein